MIKTFTVRVDLGKHRIEAVRYAAYALSGQYHVMLAPGGRKNALEVSFRPKQGGGAGDPGRRFAAELADEELRAAAASSGAKLREFIYLKALSAPPPAPAPQAASGLTPEQERELDDIIAQVEKEIKAETGRGRKDPLGITRTWEEANDKATAKKTRRR